MKRIIVNADDFGYRTQINKAIIYAYKNGVVRSTSMLVNRDAFDEAVLIDGKEILNDSVFNLRYINETDEFRYYIPIFLDNLSTQFIPSSRYVFTI